jgi:hypothetical protein
MYGVFCPLAPTRFAQLATLIGIERFGVYATRGQSPKNPKRTVPTGDSLSGSQAHAGRLNY